jgi:hypothetical protein
MRRIGVLLAIAVASVFMSSGAHAFERCDKLFANADELRNFVVQAGVRYSPKKYFDAARSIRIDIDRRPGKIFPTAAFDASGQPIIIYPAAFPPILCRIVLATFLALDKDSRDSLPQKEAARAIVRCVLSGNPREICLGDQARDLERLYRSNFAALSAQKRRNAYQVAFDALAQISRHEYAHHLLKHWEMVRSGSIARIDAEFEADFYAVFDGIQAGEVPSAMYYIFQTVADVDKLSGLLRSPDPGYESGTCRATNIGDITVLFGSTPRHLQDFAAGESKIAAPPETELPRIAQELAASGPPRPSPENCGRLKEALLREAHAELTSLAALMAEYSHLFGQGKDGEISETAFVAPEAFALIERLQQQVHTFKHIKALAARIMSITVQNVGLVGAEAKLSQKLDAEIESVADDILSDDYGRLLKVRGLRVLRQTEGSTTDRLDAAKTLFESAVALSPGLSEAWMNLAFIAYAKGECAKAAELADKADHTASDKMAHDIAEGLRGQMREALDPKRCAEDGAAFAETFAR